MRKSRRSFWIPLSIAAYGLIACVSAGRSAAAAVPTLTRVNPPASAQGATLAVMLMGTNFVSDATVAVSEPGITVTNVTVVSATVITATFTIATTAALGAANVTVTTSGGTSGAAAFTLVLPTVNVTGGPQDFGSIATGATSPAQTLMLHNTTSASLAGITPAFSSPVYHRAGGAGAGTCGATLAPGNCTINVVFSPTAVGMVNATLTITGSAEVTGSPVSLSGRATLQSRLPV